MYVLLLIILFRHIEKTGRVSKVHLEIKGSKEKKEEKKKKGKEKRKGG